MKDAVRKNGVLHFVVKEIFDDSPKAIRSNRTVVETGSAVLFRARHPKSRIPCRTVLRTLDLPTDRRERFRTGCSRFSPFRSRRGNCIRALPNLRAESRRAS